MRIQRWEDLENRQETNISDLSTNTVKPSLKTAVPGDLTTVFPEKALSEIKQYMEDLGQVMPGINAPDTLAYGLEAKFCHMRQVSMWRDLSN